MRLLAGICSAVLLFFSCSIAWGSTVLHMDLPSLVEHSDLVVMGRVQSCHSFYINESQIMTDCDVLVTESLKNATPSQIIKVSAHGGVVGDLGQSVPGEAYLTPGQQVALFLTQIGDRYFVTNMSEGKYYISSYAGIPFVYNDNTDLNVILPNTQTHLEQEQHAENLFLIHDFKALVRSLAKNGVHHEP